MDAGGGAAAGELQGVGEQVDQHDAEQAGVGIERRQAGNRPLDGQSPGFGRELFDHLGHQGAESDRLPGDGADPQSGERQQVVDQLLK